MEISAKEVESNERKDWGLKGEIIEKLEIMNSQRRAKSTLELLDDGRAVPVKEIAVSKTPKWPRGFEMSPDEQQCYRE